MTPRQQADQIIAEREAEIMAENARLRAEVAHQEGRLNGAQATLDRCLPVELHSVYYYRTKLEAAA